MKPGVLACQLAIVTILCVLGIFLFPAASGPYSAVHGPASALIAIRAAMQFYRAIAVAALCFSGGIIFWYRSARIPRFLDSAGSLFAPPGFASILRC
jgi:uncharacterized membrane protein